MKIDLGKNELIHFVGIGGIGMSGLALIMNGLGYKVQGSYIADNRNIQRLNAKKIRIFLNQIYFIYTFLETINTILVFKGTELCSDKKLEVLINLTL